MQPVAARSRGVLPHEGRHRSLVATRLGLRAIPVMLQVDRDAAQVRRWRRKREEKRR
jgi:hypothetical protein